MLHYNPNSNFNSNIIVLFYSLDLVKGYDIISHVLVTNIMKCYISIIYIIGIIVTVTQLYNLDKNY